MSHVQILMAVYNGEAYLEEQIESIIAQTHKDWELLISDDCSTDGSLKIIDSYCACDPRIHKVLDGQRFGSAKSHFMALLGIASAAYVMTCDQDDVWDQDKIELTLNAITEEERYQGGVPTLVCTDLRVVDSNLNVIHKSMLEFSNMDASKVSFGYFLASCLVTGCTMMVNHSLLVLLQEGCHEERILMHDWWASLVASAFGKVVYLNRQTLSYRQHDLNSVGAIGFSVVEAVKSIQSRSHVAKSTIAQAEELLRVYGGKLSPENKKATEAFINIPGEGPIKRICSLTKADVWRKGIMRNAATLVSYLLIPKS